MLAGVIQSAPAEEPDPSIEGKWGAPFSEGGRFDDAPPQTPAEANELPAAVSVAVLPDGRILYWDGLSGLGDCTAPLAVAAAECTQPDRSRVLKLGWNSSSFFSTPSPEDGGKDQLFCADQRVLADGRVIAAGGTRYANDPVDLNPVAPDAPVGGTSELFGSKATRLFSATAEAGTWALAEDMKNERWYPTLVTLPDGKIVVASGVRRLLYNDKGTNVQETEVFDPSTGAWTQNPANHNASLPLFARLHLLPDGKIFYSGAGQMFNPFGQSYDEAVWNVHKVYDPGAGPSEEAWKTSGIGSFGARGGAFSVMLPLKAPYDEAKLLVAGGTLGTSPGSYVANDLSEVITVKDGKSQSQITSSLNNPRWYSSGVLLPDGNVLAMSGADRDDVIGPGTSTAVRQPELFDGTRWTPLASAKRARTYHNSAILLADGSVLVGGHSPINTLYGDKGKPETGPFSNNLRDPSFERFQPPYLFRGPRPEITGAQSDIAWNSPFSVSATSAGNIKKVVLVRLPSATHTTDADMRAVELGFTNDGGNLNVTAPPSSSVAPPGYYYLFVMSDNGQGLTPSKARIVRVGAAPDLAPAPAPLG